MALRCGTPPLHMRCERPFSTLEMEKIYLEIKIVTDGAP
jgi:hypothetical protein